MFTFENPRIYYKYTNNIVIMFKKQLLYFFSLSLYKKKRPRQPAEIAFDYLIINQIATPTLW